MLVRDGTIVEVGPGLDAGPWARPCCRADGCVVTPGLVDIQVHFREPGKEEAETIESGARGAALGGFTAVVGDAQHHAAARRRQGRRRDARAWPRGLVPRHGRRLHHPAAGPAKSSAPMGELYDLGVRVFTDDGDCVADANVMRRAFEYAKALPGAVISQHAEDPDLVAGGHMHEGEWSARSSGSRVARPRQSPRSWPATSRSPSSPAAATTCSTSRPAPPTELVRAAKADGIRVTCEVSPQHLALTDEACASFDPVFKMNPPLRSAADVAAVTAGLADGTIDAIATDHAPHAPETKERTFEEAPPGMLGVETAVAVAITQLVEPGVMPLAEVIGALCWRPARIAGLDALGTGSPSPRATRPTSACSIRAEQWVVDPDRLASRSRNTPFAGWKLTGRVRHTVLRGQPTVIDREAQQ